jgi:uncharacterized protein with LGFP repeats
VTTSIQAPGGTGVVQGFQGGYIYDGPSGVFVLYRTAQTAFTAEGWVRGPLGWPTGAASCAPDGGCTQSFQGGTLFVSSTGAGFAVANPALATAYAAAGGPTGTLGYPVTSSAAISAPLGDGWAQGFAGGYIYSSTAGTFVVPRASQTAFVAAGWVRGSLGWPTGATSCGLPDGGCTQTFQGGTLFVSPTGMGFAISDASIATAYASAGGPAGALGYPTTVTAAISGPNGDGFAQGFSNGYIYSSARGVFEVPLSIQKNFTAAGWVRGSLGWPTAAASCAAGICTQVFQGGTVTGP